ncbi:hypothetical protein D3C76_297780 [compost metagenome]
MSLASSLVPVSTAQARVESIGYLALAYTGKRLPLCVLRSHAGHYIGTADNGGPVSHESVDYYPSQHDADHALTTGRWQQRPHP